MHPKQSGEGDVEIVANPVRTSDRIRRSNRNPFTRSYLFYGNFRSVGIRKKKKSKTRKAASQIAKMLRPGSRVRKAKSNVCFCLLLLGAVNLCCYFQNKEKSYC